MKAALALLAAILSLPLPVAAADLSVSYLVEEKPLKAAVAGTPLTFELYKDGACTGPVAHSEVQGVEDVSLLARLKPFNPKNVLKKLNTVELHAVLTGVSTAGSLYLKISGEGVAPVGSTCQLQQAAVPASAVLRGADGSVIGIVLGSSNFSLGPPNYEFRRGVLVMRSVSGTPVVFSIAADGLMAQHPEITQVLYATNDCTGAPYITASPGDLFSSTARRGSTLYYPSGPPTAANAMSIQSCWSEYPYSPGCGSCGAGAPEVSPASALDTSQIVPPLVLDLP